MASKVSICTHDKHTKGRIVREMEIKHRDLVFDIPVEGWDAMVSSPKTRTRALTLQALCNLELRAAVGGYLPPRQREILAEVQRLQEEMGVTPLKNSPFQIQKNLKALNAEKHIFYKQGVPEQPKETGASGKKVSRKNVPTSPWASRYVYPLIYETLKTSDANKHVEVEKLK